jgi:hypothetical protein
MSFQTMHEQDAIKRLNVRLECFWAFWKVQNEGIPKLPSEGRTEGWKAFKPRVEAAYMPKWAHRSQESMWESGGEMGDGAEHELRNVRCAQKMTKSGVAG